ncbi:MAG: hypothetical protein FWD80_07260 [Propionibacteriaceae bacterium]|nr:hypothetical protein [Propionibacteriaceae bacterium]
MISDNGLRDLNMSLSCILRFMDSALEIRQVDNYSAHWYEDFATGDQGSTQIDGFDIVFIFREWYGSMPGCAKATLVYRNGSVHFVVDRAKIDGTDCASVFELRTMTEEDLSVHLEMLHRVMRAQAFEMIEEFDSIRF